MANRHEGPPNKGEYWGPGLVEYVLVIVIIAIALIAVLTIMGSGPGETMRQIVEALGLSP